MLRIVPLLFFLFLACDEQQPLDESIALAYAELRIAEHEYGDTEEGKIARFQILQKHDLDLDGFEEKMEGIKKDDANWLDFQKIVVGFLDSINREAINVKSSESKE